MVEDFLIGDEKLIPQRAEARLRAVEENLLSQLALDDGEAGIALANSALFQYCPDIYFGEAKDLAFEGFEP